jgi:hypothetical protein
MDGWHGNISTYLAGINSMDTKEQKRIWAEIGKTTINALVAQRKNAEAQQAQISANLSQAQQAVNNLVIQHGCTSCSSILRIIPKNADPEPLSVEITSSNLKVCLKLKPMHRSRREETSQMSIQNPCGRNQQQHLRSQL